MATIVPTITYPARRRIRAVWAGMASGDVGAAVDFTRYSDKTGQLSIGTLGTGTLVVQGSNDGTKWAALKEPDGTVLTALATDADVFAILENPQLIRPNVGGAGGVNWTVTLEGLAGG